MVPVCPLEGEVCSATRRSMLTIPHRFVVAFCILYLVYCTMRHRPAAVGTTAPVAAAWIDPGDPTSSSGKPFTQQVYVRGDKRRRNRFRAVKVSDSIWSGMCQGATFGVLDISANVVTYNVVRTYCLVTCSQKQSAVWDTLVLESVSLTVSSTLHDTYVEYCRYVRATHRIDY